MAKDQNVYILLGLDPSVRDVASIEKALEQKFRELSGPSINALADKHARQFLEKNRKKLLGEESSFRTSQAEEAKRIFAEQQRALEVRLEQLVNMVRINGKYSDQDILTTKRTLGGAYSEQQIEDAFRKAGLKRQAESTEGHGKRLSLDRSLLREIRAKLDIVGSPDLYAFLSCEPDVSSSTLVEKASELDNELRRKPSGNASVLASQDLVGICRSIFSDDDKRRAYDRNLAFEPMLEFDHLIEQAGSDQILSFIEYQLIIESALGAGITLDVAHDYISEFAERRSWPSVDSYKDIVQKNDTPSSSATAKSSGSSSRATFAFLGKQYRTKETLADALGDHWVDAIGLLKTRHTEFLNWLKHDLGHTVDAENIAQVQSKGLADDAAMLVVLHVLAPKRPLKFRSTELTSASLIALADKAMSDEAAGATLQALYQAGVPNLDAVVTSPPWLTKAGREWERAVKEYEILKRRINPHVKIEDLDSPKFKPQMLVLLIAASTPGSHGANSLRGAATKVHSSDACECDWYASLGSPTTTSVAALLIIPQAAPAAQLEARTKRAEEAKRAAEERYTRFVKLFGVLTGVGIGVSLGTIVGSYARNATFGFIVGGAASAYAASVGPGLLASISKNANTVRAIALVVTGFAGILALGPLAGTAGKTTSSPSFTPIAQSSSVPTTRTPPPSTTTSAISQMTRSSLCGKALNIDRNDWDTRTSFRAYVTEAKARHFSVGDCRVALGLSRSVPTPTSAGSSIAQMSTKDLCSKALNYNHDAWDSNTSYQSYVNAARSKQLSIDDCRKALELNSLAAERIAKIPSITFNIKNDTQNSVGIIIFDSATSAQFAPESNKYYSLNSYSSNSYKLPCVTGQKLCYGAWKNAGTLSPYWGVGRYGKESCIGCCTTCAPLASLNYTLTNISAKTPEPTLTWTLNNKSGQKLLVEFYSITRSGHAWPGGDQAYILQPGEKTFTLHCQKGEKVCYGAWKDGLFSSGHWGVGKNASSSCQNCCYTCDGQEISTKLIN